MTQKSAPITSLHDSADTPEGFARCLDELTLHLGAETSNLLVLPLSEMFVENHGFSFHDFGVAASVQAYEHHWRYQDQRFKIASRYLGQALSDIELIEPEVFERSPLYNEHLARCHCRYSLFTVSILQPI